MIFHFVKWAVFAFALDVYLLTAVAQQFEECGLPHEGARTRIFHPETNIAIVGGREASIGDFPWHASIYYYQEPTDTYALICGGTLVPGNVVISAAHCFVSESGRTVVENVPMDFIRIGLGHIERDFNSTKDRDNIQLFRVKRLIVHPDYTGFKDNYGDDIAVVVLDRPARYTKSVRPACLDYGANNKEEIQLRPGYSGKVAGWGLTANGTLSDTLIGVNVPFVARNECLQNTENFFNFITKDKLCGGNYTAVWATVCQGDSGGGYVSFEKDTTKYYLRGLVSLGGKECTDGDYSLFTNIGKHAQFLSQYVDEKGGRSRSRTVPLSSMASPGQPKLTNGYQYRDIGFDNGYRYRDLGDTFSYYSPFQSRACWCPSAPWSAFTLNRFGFK